MKKMILAAATLFGLATASPALAVTSGNIVNLGSTGFTYGSFSGGSFSSYTMYAQGSSQCLQFTSNFCFVGNDTYAIVAQGSPSLLLAHPGPGNGGNSVVRFTPGQTGRYQLTATATSADSGTKQVGYFTTIGGVTTFVPSGLIGSSSSQAIGNTVVLGAGDSIGVFVNNFDGYNNDSTFLAGRIDAVPEPATWAMMLLGFGMVGFGLRRRAGKMTTRVAFG